MDDLLKELNGPFMLLDLLFPPGYEPFWNQSLALDWSILI